MVENAALRAIRLLDLVPYIVSHPGISIAELAREFSISRDEVLKDLNLLFLCGLPGYTPLELIDISFDEESVVIRDPQNLAAPRNLNESEALIARIAYGESGYFYILNNNEAIYKTALKELM